MTIQQELQNIDAIPEKKEIDSKSMCSGEMMAFSNFNQAIDSIDYTKLEQYFIEKFTERINIGFKEEDFETEYYKNKILTIINNTSQEE